MHTALRKCCDSSITSAAYNLIHLLCSVGPESEHHNPWNLYGAQVAKLMNDGMKPLDAAKRATDDLDDQLYEIVKSLRESGEKEPCFLFYFQSFMSFFLWVGSRVDIAARHA